LANYWMRVQVIRRVAISLIALFLFAQGSVVLAACAMDRASMAQAMTMESNEACSCGTAELGMSVTASCVAHCTVDLQLAGLPIALVQTSTSEPVLLVKMGELNRSLTALSAPPPIPLPRRILLHSFLI
jgi:hypothetical protein